MIRRMAEDTEDLYNHNAQRWQRRKPNSLSDFTARPRIFELCGDVSGKDIIDLGAGEGYCARVLAEKGARSIHGVELSEQMVTLAREQMLDESTIQYHCGNVVKLGFDDSVFDLAIGVFVYNYLLFADVCQSFQEVYRVLKPGGSFIFSVPHPVFPFIKPDLSPPFYFDLGEKGYYSSRDQLCDGQIYCRDGQALPVQMIPKLFEDYFEALKKAKFNSLPEIEELGVTDELLALDKGFFGPLIDTPLHLVFKVQK